MEDEPVNYDTCADDLSEDDPSIEDIVLEALRAEKTDPDTISKASADAAYQEDIAFLNQKEDESFEATAISFSDAAPPRLAVEKMQTLKNALDPESLQKLQFLGLVSEEDSPASILENLCGGVPVKVRYQPEEWPCPLILLIKPDLTQQHLIHLTLMPYLNVSHPLITP